MFNKLQRMKDHKKSMHPLEQKAKMGVVGDLQKMAEDAMGHKLNGLKKVSIESNSPEGLREGLEHAHSMLKGEESPEMYAEGGMTETHPTEALSDEDSENPLSTLPDAFDDSHPDHENFTHSENDEDGMDGMSTYPDADGDHLLEAHEYREHQDDESHENDPTEPSDDELIKHIQMLMEKKNKKGIK